MRIELVCVFKKLPGAKIIVAEHIAEIAFCRHSDNESMTTKISKNRATQLSRMNFSGYINQ